jgi:26S proteasome regulatory subunit N2
MHDSDAYGKELKSLSALQVGTLLEQHAPRTLAPGPEQAAGEAAAQGGAAEAGASEALPNGVAAGQAPADDMDTDAAAAADAAPAISLTPEEERYLERYNRLTGIISGATSIGLYLEFLYSHNHADLQVKLCNAAQFSGAFIRISTYTKIVLQVRRSCHTCGPVMMRVSQRCRLVVVQILKNVKTASEARNSVCHSAVIFANAIMHSGTTVDSFLRENLDWLSRATNWAKFSATAGLGVIHRGHLSQVGRCIACGIMHALSSMNGGVSGT